MPPKGLPQPTPEERQQVVEWITKGLEIARSRPAPKNGLIRRLTVAQYRNTLRELLLLEDDLTETLPPDAISKDGFVNNQETLQLSPLQLEAYLEIAGEALTRAIVDPAFKPAIQNFRDTLAQNLGVMILFNVLFSSVIAFGVVFLLGLVWSRIHRQTCRHANPRGTEQAA